jgi:hypothetical protein
MRTKRITYAIYLDTYKSYKLGRCTLNKNLPRQHLLVLANILQYAVVCYHHILFQLMCEKIEYLSGPFYFAMLTLYTVTTHAEISIISHANQVCSKGIFLTVQLSVMQTNILDRESHKCVCKKWMYLEGQTLYSCLRRSSFLQVTGVWAKNVCCYASWRL